MKTFFTVLTLILFISCNKEQSEEKFFKAISFNNKDTAYLKLSEIDNQFNGKYLVIYSDKTSDLGNISGEIIGDTLKGRNKYVSRRKSEFIKPIAFLKENENLKQGTGMVSYYFQIPFYANGTIQFPDSLFQFIPIDEKEIIHLKQELQF
ncbi:hypothetical protein EG240_11935 [Paenimyroides tangerinum]|uniref:Lipoprotein n=1 Tax=Paenimyroides tangerinum TaxID=2488728 RepID=A0A3P3W2M0_9FLAO|nr:hypothetical protein [Paenimyroides tangerinum]RRJ89341.1 hypothetical protein EG240_11935 [Paenimyroides tangerinum]